MTWNAGEGGNGFSIEALGGARTVVNGFNATGSAANSVVRFMGREALTFTRDWNMNSDGTLRNRVIVTNNSYQPLTFTGNFSNSGRTVRISSSRVPACWSLTEPTPRQTSTRVTATMAPVSSSTEVSCGSTPMPRSEAPRRLRPRASMSPATMPTSVSAEAPSRCPPPSTTRCVNYILTAASGIDVAAGQTFTMAQPTQGAFGLTKTGPGTLALNNSANTITRSPSAAPNRSIRTSDSSATPAGPSRPRHERHSFATASVTINSGTLSLADAAAQVLTIPTLTYGAAGRIATNGADVLTATALARGNTFNSVGYGTLVINPSSLSGLGTAGNEQFTTGTAQTVVNGTLATPSVFAALSGANQPATFVTFGAPFTGFGAVSYSANTLAGGTFALTDLIDVPATGDILNAGAAGVYALRTAGNIAVGSQAALNLGNGGLILNREPGLLR